MIQSVTNYVFGINKIPNTPLIIRIKTDNLGISDNNSFTIPVQNSLIYNYWVDWGDGTYNWYNKTITATHTWDTAGEKIIKIHGEFPKFYFNNSGDRLKLLEIINWGYYYGKDSGIDQSNAFYGCSNLTRIAYSSNGWYNFIKNGLQMFRTCALTSLPNNMSLINLTDGIYMFYSNNISGELPSGMVLGNLLNAYGMFTNNLITKLPDSMTLANLKTACVNASFTVGMFANNLITKVPEMVTLNKLEMGGGGGANNYGIFGNNPINDISNIRLDSLGNNINLDPNTSGRRLFSNSANIPVSQYSQLLINLSLHNTNNNIVFDVGLSTKYNSSAITARQNLIDRGWTITDGGLI